MGQYDSFLDAPDAPAGKYDSFLDDAPAPKQNTSLAGDIGTGLKRGVLQMPGMVTGLADLATTPIALATGVNRPISKAADWAGEKTGFQPEKWAKNAEAEYSPEMQQAQANVEAAQGFFPTLGAVAENPRVAAQLVAESLPSTIAGGVLARGAMGAVMGAEKLAALRAAAGSADVAVANAAKAQLLKSGAIAAGIGEGAVTSGQQMSQTGYEVDPALAAGTALAAGIGTGVIGAGSGRLTNSAIGKRLGLSDLETSMAAGTLGENAGKAGLASYAKRIGAGTIQEGLLEEAPQSYQEQVWQNLASGKPWDEGAASAAAQGAIAGGLMGGAVNAIPRKSTPAPEVPPAIPDPSTGGTFTPDPNGGVLERGLSIMATAQAEVDALAPRAIDTIDRGLDLVAPPTAPGFIPESELPIVGQPAPEIDAQPIDTGETENQNDETLRAYFQAQRTAAAADKSGAVIPDAIREVAETRPQIPDVALPVETQNTKVAPEANNGPTRRVDMALPPAVTQQQLADQEASRSTPRASEQLFTEDAPVSPDQPTQAPAAAGAPSITQGTTNGATTTETQQAEAKRPEEQPAAPVARPASLPNHPAAKIVAKALPEAKDVQIHSTDSLSSEKESGATRRMSKWRGKTIERLAKVFGRKRVVFFSSANTTADGMNIGGGDTLYVNIDSGVDPIAVVGHEWRHALKTSNAAAHAAINQAATKLLDQPGRLLEFAKAYHGAELNQEDGGSQATKDRMARIESGEATVEDKAFLAEEFSADMTGNLWRDPKALKEVFDTILEQHPPSAARTIIKSIGDAIIKLINKLIVSTPKQQFSEMGISKAELLSLRKEIQAAMSASFKQDVQRRLDKVRAEQGEVKKLAHEKKAEGEKTQNNQKYYKDQLVERPANLSPERKGEDSHVDFDRIRELGTTHDLREAGYIKPNGELIDLSGKKEGGQPGTRSYDHREAGGSKGMQEFIALGNVRMDMNAGAIDISAPPTKEQYNVIKRISARHRGEVVIDLNDGLGEEGSSYYRNPSRTFSNTYQAGTNPERIIADIRKFFSGETPVPIRHPTKFSPRRDDTPHGKTISKVLLSNQGYSVLTESEAQSGPYDGGCLIAAKAIVRALDKGALVRLVSDVDGGQTEHYGAKVDGVIYDASGGFTTGRSWADYFSKEEMLPRSVHVEDGYDETSEIPEDLVAEKELARLLATRLSPSRQTETPEFKKWFGSSRVVDEQGRPMVVYHGAKEPITTFKFDKDSLSAGWFSPNKFTAEGYGENVIAAYLRIERPVSQKELFAEAEKAGIDTDDAAAFRRFATSRWDGIVLSKKGDPETHYVPFYPTQIKSATDNNGQLDGENPDIRFSPPRLNSNGEPIHLTEEGLRNFWKWFGNGKLVDEQGRPLVLYRGDSHYETPTSFSISKTRENGVFLTDDEAIAKEYTGRSGNAPQALYVRGDKVLDLRDDTTKNRKWVKAWAKAFDDWTDRVSGEPVDAWDTIEGGRLFDYEGDWSSKRWRDLQAAAADDYDVLIVPDSLGGEIRPSFIALHGDSQIKSASGNNGQFSPTNSDIRFSPPRFFSQLATSINQIPKKMETMPAPQWKMWLNGNAPKLGIKKDEIVWSGIEDYLTLRGKEKVTKAEVQQFLSENGTQVNDVMLGEVDTGDVESWWGDEGGANEETPFYELSEAEQKDAIKRYREEVQAYAEEGTGTKFSQYVLPGGENYRELLITLPAKVEEMKFPEPLTALPNEYVVIEDSAQPEGRRFGVIRNDQSHTRPAFGRWPTEAAAIQDALQMLNYKQNTEYSDGWRARNETGRFKSSHYDQPNILAHIRMNERTDAEGDKVLFLEELQSDWGQKGKKDGFAGDRGLTIEKRTGVNPWAIVNKAGEVVATKASEEAAKMYIRDENAGVPSAPFVQDTKSWVALGLKRAIMYAVQNGMSKVAWANGEQQADRYDLSKQIDEITFLHNPDGTYKITASNSGSSVLNESDATIDRIEALVGKDIAKKVAENDGIPIGSSRNFDEATKPQSVRELAKDVFGGEMASLMSLEHVNGGVLPSLKHDQVVNAVIKAIPVDVMNIFSDANISPKDLFSKKDVVTLRLPVDSRSRAADGILSALRLTHATIRTKLSSVLSGGPNVELLPALFASDLNAREVASVVSPSTIFHGGASLSFPNGFASARSGAKPSGIDNSIKLDPTTLADFLNRHGSLLQKENKRILPQKYIPPTAYAIRGSGLRVEAAGMRAFYDKIVPLVANDVLKKLGGGKVETVRVAVNQPTRERETRVVRDDDGTYAIEVQKFDENEEPYWEPYAFGLTKEQAESRQIAGGVVPYMEQMGLAITPAMQSKVQTEGVPLFSTRRSIPAEDIDRVSVDSFSYNQEADDYYYHVTSSPNADKALKSGLQPGKKAMFGAYQNYSKGKIFLTERDGVMFWMSRVEDQLFDKYDDPPDVAVLRVLKSKLKGVDIDEVGTQDAKHPAFKYSTPRGAITNQPINQSWQDPDTLGKWDDFVRTMQDKLVDTKRVITAIRAAGVAIRDTIDPYLQEVLYHGRAAKRVADFADNELRPMLVEMGMRKIERQDLEDYLWARHATERNAQIAKINPKMPDGGSGLTNQQASDILAGHTVTVGKTATDPGRDIKLNLTQMPGFRSLAAKIDAITKETTDTLVRYGLETQDTVDAWRNTYGKYIPLMRDMESDDNYAGAFNLGLGTGQGFSVRGSASKRALGSERGVIDILANVAMQRERAIVRGEKNRVAQSMYGLAITAPNPDFWLPLNPDANKDPAQVTAELVTLGLNPIDAANIAQEPKQRYTNPTTGMVMERINPQLRARGDVLAVRINGKDRYVMFSSNERAQKMVAGLKNLDVDQLGMVMQKMAVVTRWFAAINTQYNPVFGLTNGIRDLGTGMLNLSSTELKGHQAEVFKNAFSALRGVYADLRDHRAGRTPTSRWALEYEEFALEGGQTGYRDMFQTSRDRTEGLMKELNDATKGKTLLTFSEKRSPLFGWLSDYNTAIENAIRLSAYKAGKDKGMTKAQAANLAKNLTVNFNKKGLAATQLGAMYAFFNAAVQGTARIGQTLVKVDNGKFSLTGAGKKIVYGGMMTGVLQAAMSAMAGWDDDEPPQFIREKNLVIPVPVGTSGATEYKGKNGKVSYYLSVPYPLGFHVIPNIGRISTEFALGGFKNPGKRLVDMFSMIMDGFNPIGGSSGGVSQMLSPTVTDPLVALSENKDWTGKSIYKEDFNSMHPTAGWTRKKDTASNLSRWLAYGINYLTGGGKYEIGLLSPTPDQLDYLIGQGTGGVGRETLKAWQFVATAATGEDMPMYKVPIAGHFVGETTGQASETSKFYSNLKRIGEHKAALDEMQKARDLAAMIEYRKENPDAALVKQADKASTDISELKRRKRELLEKGSSPEQIKLMEEVITTRVKRYNEMLSARS